MKATRKSSAAPTYRCTREVFDAAEATWLLSYGWVLLEVVTVSHWARGYHSETTSYVLGLPRNALRDVQSVSSTV